MNYREKYQAWLADALVDEGIKEELRTIAADEKEIEDRFYKELEFGTAGLRGVIGAGTNRMNRLIVGKATQGYAQYLQGIAGAAEKGVTIAYDSRHCSDVFAKEAALVLCGNGIKVNLFEGMRAVPQLSFALQLLGSAGGIVITASHNPKQYNGYKVYGANGAQIGPETAEKVMCCIAEVQSFGQIRRMEESQALKQGLLRMIGKEVDEEYYSYVESLVLDRECMRKASSLRLVYTPLYGTGSRPVQRVLGDMGVENVFVVPQQAEPNGDFPTVQAPNPESPDAFDLAAKLADEKQADLILATDPDADRLGVAVRTAEGGFRVLTGNQIGGLMLHYILKTRKERGTLPENGLVCKSIVTSNLANAIAKDFNVRIEEVLTGFRYIGEKVDACANKGEGSFLFGFEESYGYLCGTRVRDKDAINGALTITEVAAYYASRGMSLEDGLRELFEKYGYYKEAVKSYTLYGKEGLEKIAGAMNALRQKAPGEIGGYKVSAVRDYQQQTRVQGTKQEAINLPKSNVLYYEMEEGSWVCVRPSGTEPKLKVYVNGCAVTEEQTDQKLQKMLKGMDELLQQWLA